MLIVDGFESHMTIPFLELCTASKIVLFRLPPHSTHLTQPLDVEVFQPFKHYHTEAIDQAVRLGDYNFGKLEFLAAFQSFRNQTFKPTTIRHAFKITGLVPFNPQVVLETVKASQRRRRLRTPTPPPLEPLLHTPRGPKAVIKHTQFLKQTIQIYGSLNELPTEHMERFLKGVMAEAHNQKLLTRDLHEVQEATAARLKRDSLPQTVATKSGVVTVGQCRELSSIRAKKEEEKAERAQKRKQKTAKKTQTEEVGVIEYLLS